MNKIILTFVALLIAAPAYAQRIVTHGATDQSVTYLIIDETNGTPETGVVYNTSGIDLWYQRQGSAKVSITEATGGSLTTHVDNTITEIQSGVYEFDAPDAAFASGAPAVTFGGTITGMIVRPTTVQLSAFDLQTATPTVLVSDGTGTGQIDTSGGAIQVVSKVTNEPRTIYLDPATGNDANPGTKELPKDTFAGAIAIATPGDRILLMSNLSGETITITVDNLTFEGAGPNIVVTAATSFDADPDPIALLVGDDGTTLKNLTFTSTGDGGCLSFTNKNHVRIENCIVTGIQRSLLWTFNTRHVGDLYCVGSKFTAKLHNVALAGPGARFESCWFLNTGGFDDGIGTVFNHGSLSVSNALGYGGVASLFNCTIQTITDESDVVGVQTPTELLYAVGAWDGGVIYMENCSVSAVNGKASGFIGDIIGVHASGGGIIEGHSLHVTTSSAGGTVGILADYVSNGSYHGHLAELGVCTIYSSRHDAAKVTGPVQFIDRDVAATLVDTAEIGTAGAGLTNINLPNQTMDIVGSITGNVSGSVGSVTGAVGSVTGNVGGNVTGSVGSVTGAVGSVTGNVGGIAGTINTFDELGATGNPNVLLVSEINTVGSQTSFTLVDGATFNDAYNGQTIVLYDDSNSDYPSVRIVSDYVGSTKTVTLDSAPDFTLGTDDSVRLFATAPGTAAPTASTVASAVRTELTTELGRIDATISSRNATAPLDAAGTRAALGFASANADTQLAAITSTSATAATAATTASGVVSSGTHGNAALKTLVDAKASQASLDAIAPTGGKRAAGEGTTAKNLDQIVAEAELSPEQITEIAEDVADAIGDVAATQPRINRKPAPGFTTKISRRTDGTYKATMPIRLTAGAVDEVFVFVDMSPLFGTEDYVETVGTPVVSGGSVTASASGPRDTYAVVELDGTATAGEERTVTVPVTMTSGTTVSVVFDLEVFD